jgi:hypothetical protein
MVYFNGVISIFSMIIIIIADDLTFFPAINSSHDCLLLQSDVNSVTGALLTPWD